MDIDLVHIFKIDRRLSDLSDRELFVALKQLGYDGLVTNNYKMLDIPEELAAIIKTKAVVVAVEAAGHDPVRAVGALLLELPGLQRRVRPGVSNVFRLNYTRRKSVNGWDYLKAVALSLGRSPEDLWSKVRVTDAEMSHSLLS